MLTPFQPARMRLVSIIYRTSIPDGWPASIRDGCLLLPPYASHLLHHAFGCNFRLHDTQILCHGLLLPLQLQAALFPCVCHLSLACHQGKLLSLSMLSTLQLQPHGGGSCCVRIICFSPLFRVCQLGFVSFEATSFAVILVFLFDS